MANIEAPTAAMEVRRTISPYDLSSADNPGAVISLPLLKGSNYDEWASGLKTALISRKKFGFLDGTIDKPLEDSADYEDWKTIQALLVSWIRMTIEPGLRSTISHREIAQDLWNHLKRRFSVMSGSRLQQLKSELACCKQKGLAIESYYGKLNRIWDSLATQQPVRTCTCGNCTCDLLTLQETDREEDKIHQFLYGLDDQYRSIRSSICARVPIQSLEEVYNMVRHEEDLVGTVNSQQEVTAFVTNMKQSKTEQKENRTLCAHCNRSGHSTDMCFAVIGYPEWWGDRPKIRTLNGKGKGGAARGRGQPQHHQANWVHVPRTEPNNEHANFIVTDEDKNGVKLSEEQWRVLKNLLSSNKDNSASTEKLSGMFYFSTPWILDTGASHHLTGRFELLSNVKDISPVLIIMADGRESVSVKEDSIRIGPSLMLKLVYYVEGLKSELISVTQLMDENDCVIQAAKQYLVIQDRSTRMMIGAGKRIGGTFHYRCTEVAAAVSIKKESNFDLWHSRLGHPSLQVVSMIPNFNISVLSNKACDVCLRAKQTRDCFPISNNKSSRIFELIHVDIWGPYRTPSYCGAKYFLTIVDDYSRSVWLYLLQDKSKAQIHLKNFITMAERQHQEKILTIRTDNGSEFVSMSTYFAQLGIKHETSCVGTPQQNGRVERKHRHILNIARALMFQANLPIKFWGECVLTACYLINRTPSSVLDNRSPYEQLYKKSPLYTNIRVFCFLAYAPESNLLLSILEKTFMANRNRDEEMGSP